MLLPRAHEIDQIVKLFGVRFHLSELDLGFVELFAQGPHVGKSLSRFFAQGMTRGRDPILRQIAHGRVIGLLDHSAVRTLLPHEHTEHGRFARTIRPDQGNAVPWSDGLRYLFEYLLVPVGQAYLLDENHDEL